MLPQKSLMLPKDKEKRRLTLSRMEIISTACQLFQERGYHSVTMQDIANQLSVTKAALYYYVKSKEEILYQIYDIGMKAVEQEASKIPTDASAATRLRLFIKGHLKASLQLLPMLAVFYNERHYLPESSKSEVVKRQRAYEKILAQIIEDGIKEGIFRNVEITIAVFGILGMCNWAYQWYQRSGKLTPEEIGDIFSELILTGLKRDNTGACVATGVLPSSGFLSVPEADKLGP